MQENTLKFQTECELVKVEYSTPSQALYKRAIVK